MFARLVRRLGAPATLDTTLLPGGARERVTARWRRPDGGVAVAHLTRPAVPGRPSAAEVVRLILEA